MPWYSTHYAAGAVLLLGFGKMSAGRFCIATESVFWRNEVGSFSILGTQAPFHCLREGHI